MSAQLGIGSRVSIGWAPDEQMGCKDDPRLTIGTVREGPFDLPDGSRLGLATVRGGRYWSVKRDDEAAYGVLAHEALLMPIDGGEPQAEHVDEECEVTA